MNPSVARAGARFGAPLGALGGGPVLRVALREYQGNTDCSNNEFFNFVSVAVNPAGWSTASGSFRPQAISSARVELIFSSSGGPDEIRADNAFLSPTSTMPVDLESFEID